MVTNKQARLISAVADAMLAQSFSQGNLARASGVSQSMISGALCGKYNLKEEKWRLICETLALDYDQIVEDPEPETEEDDSDSTSEIAEGGHTVQQHDENEGKTEDVVLCEEERNALAVTARYLAGHLKEDIRKGMDISLEDLHTILTVCKNMQNAAENND